MKTNLKKLLFSLVAILLNIVVFYSMTTFLNIKNVVLYQSILNNYVITYEAILFMIFSLIEAFVYEKMFK